MKRVCFFDELQDFSRAHTRSPGLAITNDYNALYAEYLFRARGDAHDEIVYRLPAPIETIKAVTFHAEEAVDFTFLVSADGKSFEALKTERRATPLPPTPGGAAGKKRRTLVEYAGAAPSGRTYLKVRWQGPAELDRVEVTHAGAR